jgi:hypothetical protein
MRGTYGSQWHLGNAGARIIPTAADFAVDRDHRGRWLAQRLEAIAQEDLAARGYEYSFNTSPNLTTRLLRIRSGWKRGATYQTFRRGDFPEFVTPMRRATRRHPNLLLRALRRGRRILRNSKSFIPFERFDRWAARGDNHVVASATPRISQMSELVSRYSDQSRIQHVRDERFYEWRLNDPRSNYRFVFCEQSEDQEGFFILQQFASGGAITIVDWAVSTMDVWTKLLRTVVDCKIDQLQITSTSFPDAQLHSLQQFRFDRVGEPDTRARPAPGIFLCNLSNADSDEWTLGRLRLLDPDRWDMRMIYSDAF